MKNERGVQRLAPLLVFVLLAACSSAPKKGGYYKDDGPEASPPKNLDRVADAKPRAEPLNRAANRPYEVFGKKYVPLDKVQPYHQRKKFHGQKTSSGETYDMYAMTAAHPILPIPSYARVTSVRTGKQVIVRINDRGPFHSGRVIDLSYAAAYRLGLIGAGSGEVEIEAIVPGSRAGL